MNAFDKFLKDMEDPEKKEAYIKFVEQQEEEYRRKYDEQCDREIGESHTKDEWQ